MNPQTASFEPPNGMTLSAIQPTICRLSFFAASWIFLISGTLAPADWLQFRGAAGNGVADEAATLPFDFEPEKHIAWKRELPGRGLSSPIVVGDRTFVTCSSGTDQDRLHVLCFETGMGEKLWERVFFATGRTMCHSKTSVAAPTPASDGRHIVALFSSNDIFCLDLDGNVLWLRGLTRDYPNASNSLGMASSPVIAGGAAVVQIENDSESFAAGLDLESGVNLWKTDRPKRANWTSPVVLAASENADRGVALQSSEGVHIVDAMTGEVLWHYDQGAATIPSAAADPNGTLYVPSHGITAIKRGPDGNAEQVWRAGTLRPGTASPLLWKDLVYVVNTSNVLNCTNANTGKRLWRIRLEGPFEGSPVAANDHLYIFNEQGLGQVVTLGRKEGKLVSTIDLGEIIQCTPAISDGALFVRSDRHLWRLGKP